MSKPDRVADLMPSASVRAETSDASLQAKRDESARGLLLIYPIDRDSAPKKDAEYRVALGARDDLIGVGFSFPKAAPGTEPEDSIQVDLRLLIPDEDTTSDDGTDDYEDAEGSQDDVDLGDV